MFELTGKYNIARVFSTGFDDKACGQIINLLNQPFSHGASIVIQPDYHFGAGCVIGFTAKGMNAISPNLLGVDLGCGMMVAMLGKVNIDLDDFDRIFRQVVPMGKNVHANPVASARWVEDLICFDALKHTYNFQNAIGTLGGGNHFGELDIDDEGNVYFVVHTGSRNLGKQVAEYWQARAVQYCKGDYSYQLQRAEVIKTLKSQGRSKEIAKTIAMMDKVQADRHPDVPEELCFLEGNLLQSYIHDMQIATLYAELNRETIVKRVLSAYFGHTWKGDTFHTIHNYYSMLDDTMRKGAVSAYKGERLIIPLNMRDGSLLCIGKGNNETLLSAPHGAGRLYGRNEAKKLFELADYEAAMEGIFTTSVGQSTLDESPFCYKPADEIKEAIEPMVEIVAHIKPIWNIKEGGE